MLIGREAIAPLLPHAGAMVLIDAVASWDARAISCLTEQHRDVANPLRAPDGLASLNAIEFAAQATAIHGALLDAAGVAPMRVLAAVRHARFSQGWIGECEGRLAIDARIVMHDGAAAIYDATVRHDEREIAAMRLTLMTLAIAEAIA